MDHPELAAEVDILGVQIYPDWGGLAIDAAAANTVQSVKQLRRKFPGKPVGQTMLSRRAAGDSV
jgi:hypothetical protein